MAIQAVVPGQGVADISIGIPAYNRSQELEELLASIHAQTLVPAEITLCEDKSPERDTIRGIVTSWRERFEARGCRVNYHENADNLGYDGNIRKLFEVSTASWVMLIGNDDLLLPGCVEAVARYLQKAGPQKMVSRSFIRFDTDIARPLGVSRLADHDRVFRAGSDSPRMLFRSCGFVGGLIVQRDWANSLATSSYDGTLYYQIFLAAEAFCGDGIGYVAEPIVGGRAGNPPLFGAAASEKGIHVPGSYTPRGRAKMWASVIRISDEVGRKHGINLVDDVKDELAVRQSFHVFEMMAGADRKTLVELRSELDKLGLYGRFVPRFLFSLDYVLGKQARIFFRLLRLVLQ